MSAGLEKYFSLKLAIALVCQMLEELTREGKSIMRQLIKRCILAAFKIQEAVKQRAKKSLSSKAPQQNRDLFGDAVVTLKP
jgi:hypothetical protein